MWAHDACAFFFHIDNLKNIYLEIFKRELPIAIKIFLNLCAETIAGARLGIVVKTMKRF